MPIYETEKEHRYRDHLRIQADGSSTEWFRRAAYEKTLIYRPDTIRRKRPELLRDSWTPREVTSSKWTTVWPLVESASGRDWSGIYWDYGYWPRHLLDLHFLPKHSMPASMANQLLNKIKDQKVNLSVSLAELGKTTDMASKLARDVWNSFRSLRSGRALGSLLRATKRGSWDLSGKAAKRWLEYTYGWLPTMYDVYGLSELIHQKIEKGVYIRTYVRRGLSQTVRNVHYGDAVYYDCSLRGTFKYTAEYRVDNTYLRSLSQSGISNPAHVIWELMPYSFVIDWVIDIGDYLSALDALVGVKDLRIFPSYGYKAQYEFTAKSRYSGRVTLQEGKQKAEARRSVRYPVATSIMPQLPTYEPSLSTRRLVNAVALLRNLVK